MSDVDQFKRIPEGLCNQPTAACHISAIGYSDQGHTLAYIRWLDSRAAETKRVGLQARQ